ncbi:unnamed protein product [Pylaiella littoralis]
MARSVSRGESSVASVSGNFGLGGFALFNQDAIAFDVVEDGAEKWVADTGATHHTTGSLDQLFTLRCPPPGNSNVVVGNGTVLPSWLLLV